MPTIEERLADYGHQLREAASDPGPAVPTGSDRARHAPSARGRWILSAAAIALLLLTVGGLTTLSRTAAPEPGAAQPDVTPSPSIASSSAPAPVAGMVPTSVPDGYTVWWISPTGSAGTIRPTGPDANLSDREITWVVSDAAGVVENPEVLSLADGTAATYGATSGQSTALIWSSGTHTVELVSVDDAIDRDGLLSLASSFRSASTADISAIESEIALQVRSTFQPGPHAVLDETTVELFESDGRVVALCIANDRCQTALGAVFGHAPDETVLLFSFDHADGSSDVFGLLIGTFDRLEPTDGITVSTIDADTGVWIHAQRTASTESGSVAIVNPSATLGGIVGFDV
jgi:hypothetical protein